MKGFYQISFDAQMYCGFTEEFMRFKESVEDKTALSLECLFTLYTTAKHSLNTYGIFVECGVDRGGSGKFLSQIVHGSGKKLHLFDTFSGMPESEEVDFHKKGDFPSKGIEDVRAYIANDYDVVLHEGMIQQTLPRIQDKRIAFAHIDCDLHSSTKYACEFIVPKMTRGGVIVFDDYGRHTTNGVRIAVDEYFERNPALMIPIITSGQMVVVK